MVFGGNADAGVLDGDRDLRGIHLGDHVHAPAVGRELHRVREQVQEDLLDLALVGLEFSKPRIDVEGKLDVVPLRATGDAIAVNWFSIEILNAKGKRTYFNSFVTDLAITSDSVAELAACGRARWKIENETFNILKTKGYNLEHNFGHGKETLASLLITFNLLAFAFHTAAYLAVLEWRAAVIARGPTYRFFEHLRTVTVYVVFRDWQHLLQSIAAAAIRPP